MGGDLSKADVLAGDGQVTLSDLIKYLKNETKFTTEEVEALIEHFRWINQQVTGNNDVRGVTNDPEAIIWLLGFWGCHLDQLPVLADYFTAMDSNVDGHIDVHEYLVTLSTMARGDDKEQLKLMFHAIDNDRDDVISREQIKGFIQRMITSEVYWLNYIQSLELEDGVDGGLEFDVSDIRRDAQVEMEFRAVIGAIKEEEEITEEVFVKSLYNSGFEITFIIPVIDQLKSKTLKELRSIPDTDGEIKVELEG